MRPFPLFIASLALSACVTTTQEVPGTITIGTRTYETVTRTFQRDDGSTYARTTVFVGTQRASCRPDDFLDCRGAVNEILWYKQRF